MRDNNNNEEQTMKATLNSNDKNALDNAIKNKEITRKKREWLQKQS